MIKVEKENIKATDNANERCQKRTHNIVICLNELCDILNGYKKNGLDSGHNTDLAHIEGELTGLIRYLRKGMYNGHIETNEKRDV